MLRKNKDVFSNMLAVMDYVPLPQQQEVIDAFFDGKRFLVVVAGRRGGKTRLASWFGLYALMEKDCNIWIVAKTYDLTKRVWDYLIADVEKFFDGCGFQIKESELSIKMPWGAVLECKSADHPRSLIGKGIDVLIVDEAAEVEENIWMQRLAPTIRDRKGTAIFITTPLGRGWIYERYADGQRGINGYWSLQYPSWSNTFVYDAEEIELAKKQHDDKSFRQQYGAEFVSYANMVYSDFDRNKHVKPVPENLEGYSVSLAVDPGYNGACAMLWIAHNRVYGEDIVIKEIVKSKMKYEDVLEAIKENEPEGGYEALICDIAGHSESQETGRSFVAWMEDQTYFKMKRLHWSFLKSGIDAGLQLVRSKFLNAAGETRLFIGDKCFETIYGLENYAYPEGSRETPVKDNRTDHPCDALRYYIVWRYNTTRIVSLDRID